MKKILVFLMTIMLIVPYASAAQPISVYIDGQQQNYTQSPVIENGSTLVPLRGIFESLGAEVKWDQATKTVTATKNSTIIVLKIGSSKPTINGVKKDIPVPGKLINGNTMVPLRFVSEALGADVKWDGTTRSVTIISTGFDVALVFPEDKYPETAAHIKKAIENGESSICTIDRDGADKNRDESLAGIPTKDGFDRDEWPMAMCEEGGAGASVMYVDPSDNRGAGSWVSNQLEQYPNGTPVLFVVDGNTNATPQPVKPAPISKPTPAPQPAPSPGDYTGPYDPKGEDRNCSDFSIWKDAQSFFEDAGPGDPHGLDRDGNGLACESLQ